MRRFTWRGIAFTNNGQGVVRADIGGLRVEAFTAGNYSYAYAAHGEGFLRTRSRRGRPAALDALRDQLLALADAVEGLR